MYVVTYETSSLLNVRFLQHALFDHVCYRSLCFIFTELVTFCSVADPDPEIRGEEGAGLP